jgi:predicted GNAT family acetyltransferase
MPTWNLFSKVAGESCRHDRSIRSRQQGAKPVRTRRRGRGGVRELSPHAIGRHHHHTETPRALRGRGIASELVEGALRLIRADGLKVVAGCGFVVDYLRKHPEFADLAG